MQASPSQPAESASYADRPATQTIRIDEIRRPGTGRLPTQESPLDEKQAAWLGGLDTLHGDADAGAPSGRLDGSTPADPTQAPAGHPAVPPAASRPALRDTRREDHENNKLSKRLYRLTGQAIADYDMIGPNDRVMVCLSGGKDSFAMLDILLGLQKRAPVPFSIVAVNLDQRQPGFPADVLPNYLKKLGVEYHIETEDTYSTVQRVIPDGKTKCSLCSRLRRGILYRVASELGATRIALGHHRDDILATFFLNLFYGGQLKTMPAKLVSDDGRHVVIRPLAYVEEKDLIRWAEVKNFPIIPCNLCGSQPNLKRAETKELLKSWEKRFPGRLETIFSSLGRVRPSHLMDRTLYDFNTLRTGDDAEDCGERTHLLVFQHAPADPDPLDSPPFRPGRTGGQRRCQQFTLSVASAHDALAADGHHPRTARGAPADGLREPGADLREVRPGAVHPARPAAARHRQ